MVEENHCCNSNLLSTSMGSSIKINSISIDLLGANEEIGVGKCEHFSIRGFVSEIRQTDWKKCWPFSLNGNHDNFEEQKYMLPPLSVPQSRWWRCESCLREMGAEGNVCDNGLELLTTSNALWGRKVDADTPAIRSTNDLCPPACSEKKEKNREVASLNLRGNNGIGSDRNASINQETFHLGDITLLKIDRRKSTESCMVGNKSRKSMGVEKSSRKLKGKVNKSKEIIGTEDEELTNGQHAEVITGFGSSDIAGVVDDAPNVIKKHKRAHPSPELDECDNVSSESAILARNNSMGLHRRKTRRVRLLSELLGKADANATGTRGEVSPSSVIPDSSNGVRGRKRKLPEDEPRSPEIISQNNYVNRKLGTISKNPEIATQSGDSEDNTFSGAGGIQTSVESQSTDNGFDSDPIKGKRKNRKFQVVDENLPAVSRENSQKGIQENDQDSGKGNAVDDTLFTSAPSAFTGRDLVPCPLHAQKTEKKPTLSKKKNKKPLIIERNNGMPEENLITRRNTECLQSNPANIPSQNAQDPTDGKGLDLSLTNFLASERHARKHMPQLKTGPSFSSPWQEGLLKDHGGAGDAMTSNVQDFGSSSKAEVDAYFQTGLYVDFSGKGNANRIPFFLNEKQRHTSATGVGDHSLAQQVDASGARGKGKAIAVQEHSGTARNSNANRAEKIHEHLDDIPMEIVELMAKNQYERCLPDSGDDNKQSSQATNTSKNALLIDLNKTYENGVSQEDNNSNHTSRKPKNRGKSARKSEATKKNFIEFFPHSELDSYNTSQFGRPYYPSGFGVFPQSREHPPGSIQFSAVGSSGQSGTSNCQWIGNMARQSPPPSSFRVLRPCNMCQSVPHQYKEASHLWQPVVPNHLPVSYNMSQKYNMEQSSKMDMLSRANNNDLKLWNLNFHNLEKQKRGFDSEYSFGCKHSGINRSLDPYSNESSIPAMHLLSLMDPRLRSNTPGDLTGNPKVLKRPTFSQLPHSKEFAGLQPGECNKTTNIMNQPPFDCYGKKLSLANTQEIFRPIPTAGTSAFLFQNDSSFAKGTDFMAQASMKYQEKKQKAKDYVPPEQNRQKSVLPSCDAGKFQFLGTSDSSISALKFHTNESAKKQKAKVQSYNATTVLPPRSSSGAIICGVNRNPADFTVPEAGNAYMIKGEDLKFRKQTGYGRKTGIHKPDGQKPKKKLVASAREHA